ncbi:MAG TPA: phenylalanine--tRNA ligase subunit alpha, partial [Elusimicrobiales bacterium]|nr:phenylalanine--tRNA ligase subunit alpha [Elusimicrobiales bacterium]
MNRDEWKEKLSLIKDSFFSALSQPGPDNAEALKVAYLGRKGELSLLLRDLKDFPIEERKALGALGNALKAEFEAALDAKAGVSGRFEARDKCAEDLTLPGYPFPKGGLHPLTVAAAKMCEGFQKLGFSVADGPLIEEDLFNF